MGQMEVRNEETYEIEADIFSNPVQKEKQRLLVYVSSSFIVICCSFRGCGCMPTVIMMVALKQCVNNASP